MRIAKSVLLVTALLVIGAAPAMAQDKGKQKQRPRVSPHETTSAVIENGARVTVTYGRPYSKNPRGEDVRKIWGGLVPYGKAWRLGADEATTLLTQQPLAFGSTTIPAGVYTLYMVPQENGAKLAFSSALGGWGVPVDEKHDVARIDMKKEAVEADAPQLQIAVEKEGSGGVLKITWEKAQYSAPFTIKK
jgi:hypothetical protein